MNNLEPWKICNNNKMLKKQHFVFHSLIHQFSHHSISAKFSWAEEVCSALQAFTLTQSYPSISFLFIFKFSCNNGQMEEKSLYAQHLSLARMMKSKSLRRISSVNSNDYPSNYKAFRREQKTKISRNNNFNIYENL